jgi:hypothetical protein
MLDKITANQQARAFAMGAGEYERKYAGQYSDYEKNVAKRTNARQGLLSLADFYYNAAKAKDDSERQNLWAKYNAETAHARDVLNTGIEARRAAKEDELMEKAMMLEAETNKQEWWQPYAQAAIGGLTSAATGGLTSLLIGKRQLGGI